VSRLAPALVLALAVGCGPRAAPPAEPEPPAAAPEPDLGPVELPGPDTPPPDIAARLAELADFPDQPTKYNLPNDAVRTLARLGPAASSYLVRMLLKHDRAEVRQLAAHTLGQMGPAAEPAVPALARALADPSRNVRLTAADALAHIGKGAAPAAPALGRAFRDEPPNVGDQKGLEESSSARLAIIRALAAAGEPGRKVLGEVVVPIMVDDLKNDRTVRVATGTQLSACGPVAAPCLPHIVAQLRKRPSEILDNELFAAVIDLGPEGVGYYRQLLMDSNTEIRRYALRAFYGLKIDVTVFAPEIAAAMRDADLKVRGDAVAQVPRFPAPPPTEVVAAVVGLLGDPGAIAQPPYAGIEFLDKGAVTQALVHSGRRAVPGTAAALASADPLTRIHAATALGEIGPAAADAVLALREVEKDQHLGPAVAAYQARYKITADADALAGLAALADGQPVDGRLLVAQALAACGPAAVAHEGVFLPLLDDENPAVRDAARTAACELGPRARRAGARIAAGFRVPTDLGRSTPTPLSKLGPALAPAVPALRSFLRQETILHSLVHEVLEAIGPAARAATPELLEIAVREDYHAISALKVLGAIRPPTADALTAGRAGVRNRSEFARMYALRLLGDTGPAAREALPLVREALRDPDAAVRVWAIYAGIRIEGTARPYVEQLTRELGAIRDPGPGSDGASEFAIRVVPRLAPEAPEVLPSLIDLLRRGGGGQLFGGRSAAFRAVVGYGAAARDVVPMIVAELAAPRHRAEERAELCEALGALGPAAAAALPALRARAEAPGWKAAWAARRAIDRIEGRE
ncbi:MAG TPA: HEAT repeat domain-containing protein, partial [Urbifossiella sp.]|nr:HEAT repeat domain-containing protein [Urbifossiella sp.]